MAFPHDFGIMGQAENRYFQHKVLKDGKVVGVSMWRTYTLYYRRTISLCCIDDAVIIGPTRKTARNQGDSEFGSFFITHPGLVPRP
jgi:hypothetical protein